jgi:hypothetical protein
MVHKYNVKPPRILAYYQRYLPKDSPRIKKNQVHTGEPRQFFTEGRVDVAVYGQSAITFALELDPALLKFACLDF